MGQSRDAGGGQGRLTMMLNDMKGYERVRTGCKALHALNRAFR